MFTGKCLQNPDMSLPQQCAWLRRRVLLKRALWVEMKNWMRGEWCVVALEVCILLQSEGRISTQCGVTFFLLRGLAPHTDTGKGLALRDTSLMIQQLTLVRFPDITHRVDYTPHGKGCWSPCWFLSFNALYVETRTGVDHQGESVCVLAWQSLANCHLCLRWPNARCGHEKC